MAIAKGDEAELASTGSRLHSLDHKPRYYKFRRAIRLPSCGLMLLYK